MGCCKKDSGRCGSSQGAPREATGSSQAEPDYLVCTCMGVMRSEIVEAIEAGAQTFQELSEKLGVGTGCSSCVQEVHDLLKDKLSGGCCRS